MSYQISTADRRMNFDVAKRVCQENNIDVKNARPAYGYLRLEVPIQDAVTQYKFPILQMDTYNGVPAANTENRLALQDNFVVGSKGFFLYWRNKVSNKPASTLLTGFTPYNFPKAYSWGNSTQTPYAAPLLTLQGLSNEYWISGWMKYTFDYNVVIPRYDCLQHYKIEQNQATQRTVGRLTGADFPEYPYPWMIQPQDGLSDGFMPMEPNIIFSGGKNNEIIYNLPFAITFAELSWDPAELEIYEPRIALVYRGVLLQNTTNVK